MSLDDEWLNFLDNNINISNCNIKNKEPDFKSNKTLNQSDAQCLEKKIIPKCGEIYISTKTKIVYLNTNIDIYDTFWKLPVIDYDLQKKGIIKKQIKISSINKDEIAIIDNSLEKETSVSCKILSHIDNPNGIIKYKHVRKISIGISKKDLIYLRSKEKSAFYNCFVIVLRTIYNDSFKEFHVKIFNTGKLEIPGIQNDKMMYIIITDIIDILRNIVNDSINYLENRIENILINSNFNCGFYINREKLFDILRYKYYINACYDPCSYPGIQCMYYYDNNTNNDNVVTTEKKKNYKNFI